MPEDRILPLFEEPRWQRDELRLQIHLAGAGARREWEKREAKQEQIRPKLEQAAAVIKKGWQWIRNDLSRTGWPRFCNAGRAKCTMSRRGGGPESLQAIDLQALP